MQIQKTRTEIKVVAKIHEQVPSNELTIFVRLKEV